MIIQGTAIKGMTVSSSAAGITSDSYFNLVSLLLPGNGTNGAQNNTFLDSSASPLTVTRNGSVTQGAFSPFTFGSGTQTDGYYSGYFDGTGDYLSVGDQSAFEFGSGNYTVEFWWFATTSADQNLIGKWDGGGSEWILQWRNAGYFRWAANGGVISDATISLSLNTWNHIAISKSGTSLRIFVNGIQTNTTATEGTISATSASLTIAAAQLNSTPLYTTGQLSNIRIVKGTAVYTSNFTVPTAPLTAISGTSLLTCQSSTFIDNSTNAFAITVNGNSQPSLTNPFNVTNQPVQAWSNYFDGNGDYLSNTTANVQLTGNFTVEMYLYPTTVSASNSFLYAIGAEAGSRFAFYIKNGVPYLNINAGAETPLGSTAVVANQWQHLAFVRVSTTITAYINGVSVGSTSAYTGTLGNSTQFYIGSDSGNSSRYTGFISNFRAVNGTAVYTSNFAVPTTPLTAITNTQLLTCQSNRFIDNSISNFAITRAGDTSVQPFSPFDPTAAYSTSSIGASMYFDGASKLTTSASINISGVFTIESWFNSTNTGGWFFTIGNFPVYIDVSAGTVTLDKSSVGNQLVTTANEQVKGSNCWKHLAITRDGSGLIRVFVNGVFLGSVSTSYSAGTLNGLGQYASYGGAWLGYACDFRVVVGTALYTSAFTPPTAPLTAVSGTAILLSGINAGIYDAAAKNVLETVGSAQISTAQSKFGGSSMAFDGSGDALILPASQNLALETGNFTIEMWVYGANNGGTVGGSYPRLFSLGTVQTTGSIESYNAAGTLYVEIFGSSITFTASTLLNSSWNHFAISRSGSSVKAFVNGTQVGSTLTNSTNLNKAASSTSIIGASTASTGNFNGYIDDLRITKGDARYTANFTPPTSAFPTQ